MLATIVSIIRLSTAVASTKDTSDFTYTSARALLMMNVEFHVGLITGSLPSLRLLPGFRVLFASWTGDHSTKGYSGRISGNGDGSAMRNGAGSRANDMKLGRMPKSPYGDLDLTVMEDKTVSNSQERIVTNGAAVAGSHAAGADNRW